MIAHDIEYRGVANEMLYGWGELHLKCQEWGCVEDKFTRVLKASQGRCQNLLLKLCSGLHEPLRVAPSKNKLVYGDVKAFCCMRR